MAQFNLPKNSQVTEGKTWPAPNGAKNIQTFRIYRWNPDDGKNPRIDTYRVDRDDAAKESPEAAARWLAKRVGL